MTKVADMWGIQQLAANEIRQKRIGPLTIWLERRSDEMHYAVTRSQDGEGAGNPAKPEVLEWNRWICGEGTVGVMLAPALPMRPVVVRPVMPLQVLPGQQVAFFVSIPLSVSGLLYDPASKDEQFVFEEPTVVLSNSWFGEPANGTLCYALRTRARRSLEELRPEAHWGICPLRVRNQGRAPLLLERMLLRTARLGLYQGRGHLWTSAVQMVYRGEDQGPDVTYGEGPPSYDGAAACLAVAREQDRRRVFDRAMQGIRGIGKGWYD